MSIEEESDFSKFQFRGIHPNLRIGMASDRYAGWIGQIYPQGRYDKGITRRAHKVGDKSFVEEVLPVESVVEYFEHFSILEIDYTFSPSGNTGNTCRTEIHLSSRSPR
jgi:hypothetical protein